MKIRAKLLLTLLVAMMTVLTLFPTVSQAASTDVAPATGDLTIHKYLMADVTEANTPGDGTVTTNIPANATPLGGITFDIYKVEIGSDGIYPEPGVYVLDFYNAGATTKLTDSKGKVFNVAPSTMVPNVTTATVAAGDVAIGDAKAEDLPKGVYLVVEQESDLVASPASPFVVAVPMANPSGEGWNADVHVYPKNEGIRIEKSVGAPTVDHMSYDTNTAFPWFIDVSVPTDISVIENMNTTIAAQDANIEFKIIDELDSRLEYVTASSLSADVPKVYKIGAIEDLTTPGTEEIPITYANESIYTLSQPIVDAGGGTLTVTFTPAGRAYLKDEGIKFIRIIFYTRIKAAETSAMAEIPNDPTVSFKNRFSQTVTGYVAEDEIPEVHTGTIQIVKIDSKGVGENGGISLPGAVFKIAESAAKAATGEFLKDRNDQDITATTGTDGKTVIWGLPYGKAGDGVDANTSPTTYWLVEVKAPNGYNLLDSPVEVTINSTSFVDEDPDGDGDAVPDEIIDYIASVTIKNNKGFTLPVTGGTGTLIFTIAGIVLVGLAVVLFVGTKKKKNSAK